MEKNRIEKKNELTRGSISLGRHLLQIPQVFFVHAENVIEFGKILGVDLTGFVVYWDALLSTRFCRSGVGARSNLIMDREGWSLKLLLLAIIPNLSAYCDECLSSFFWRRRVDDEGEKLRGM